MERRELIYAMEKFAGASFLTRSELAKFLGYKDPHSVDKYIRGLPRLENRYFVNDIATVIQSAIN